MLAFVIGGAASGKSECAEALAMRLAQENLPLFYLATMQETDAECRSRIARHRELRQGKGFRTVECPRNLAQLQLPGQGVVLLECLSTLAANEQFSPNGAGEQAVPAILSGMDALVRQSHHVVVVSNSVFSDGIDYTPMTQRYLENLGLLHRKLAQQAELVLEIVAGLPLVLKNTNPEVFP